jgi:hypothetical protein
VTEAVVAGNGKRSHLGRGRTHRSSRVVLRAFARGAVVGVSGRERAAGELVDRRAVLRRKREVDALGRLTAGDQREGARAVGEPHALGRVGRDLKADGGRNRLVERARRREVARTQPQVVDARPARPVVVHRLDAVAVLARHPCRPRT